MAANKSSPGIVQYHLIRESGIIPFALAYAHLTCFRNWKLHRRLNIGTPSITVELITSPFL